MSSWSGSAPWTRPPPASSSVPRCSWQPADPGAEPDHDPGTEPALASRCLASNRDRALAVRAGPAGLRRRDGAENGEDGPRGADPGAPGECRVVVDEPHDGGRRGDD